MDGPPYEEFMRRCLARKIVAMYLSGKINGRRSPAGKFVKRTGRALWASARAGSLLPKWRRSMLKRYVTLTLTAAAILAAPAAFAESGQTKAGVAAKTTTKQASARQAYGAVPANAGANSGEGTAVARPPAQPGAW
jgi:hypothetical protein